MKRHAWWRLAAAGLATVVAVAGGLLAVPVTPASAEVRSNTMDRLPYRLAFADLDGDGLASLVQAGRPNKLFAFDVDFEGSPISHIYTTHELRRLVVGEFGTNGGTQDGRDRVCATFTDHGFRCYTQHRTTGELVWVFTQANFIADDEHAVVGDFTADGFDDILTYRRSTGEVRMFSRTDNLPYFRLTPDMSPGNLLNFDLRNKRLLAGEFNGLPGTDLLVENPTNGQVIRFSSARQSGTDRRTFHWIFTSRTGVIGANERASVARIENRDRDGLVLHNRDTGRLRFKRAEYDNGWLPDAPNLAAGNLTRIQGASGRLHFAPMSRHPGEPGGTIRDDVIFFNAGAGMLQRFSARWDGQQYTYWWAYNKHRPRLNTGWRQIQRDPWRVVVCRFRDLPSVPQGVAWWERLFVRSEPGSLADYFWEMTYGTVDLSGSKVHGVFRLRESSDVIGPGWDRITARDACRRAAARSGVLLPASKVIYYLNGGAGSGVFSDGQGNVMANTNLHSPAYLVHEMGHAYGLDDSADYVGTRYGDRWDAMSWARVACYDGNPQFATTHQGDCLRSGTAPTGPGYNAGNRISLTTGGLPGTRVRTLVPGATRTTSTVRVAALDRPEAMVSGAHGHGVMAVRIRVPDGPVQECNPDWTCRQTGNYLTVELREANGWDAGFDQDAVFVHKVSQSGPPLRQTFLLNAPDYQLGVGDTYRGNGVAVRVDEIEGSVATVTITY